MRPDVRSVDDQQDAAHSDEEREALQLHRIAHRCRTGADASPRTVRVQRKPKYPRTNKMITTAPTSQMILFMILSSVLIVNVYKTPGRELIYETNLQRICLN